MEIKENKITGPSDNKERYNTTSKKILEKKGKTQKQEKKEEKLKKRRRAKEISRRYTLGLYFYLDSRPPTKRESPRKFQDLDEQPIKKGEKHLRLRKF